MIFTDNLAIFALLDQKVFFSYFHSPSSSRDSEKMQKVISLFFPWINIQKKIVRKVTISLKQ